MSDKKSNISYLNLSNKLNPINNSILLFFPLAFILTTTNKALASEKIIASEVSTAQEGNYTMSQITNVKQLELKRDLAPHNLNNFDNTNSMSQVTNVNQLRDVSPTDWAYEALRSLVDRYGCIAGFPNQTYRGGQPLSRYEFAAGLNSCLNQIERLIASSESVVKEDLDTIQRLTQEFEAELATIGGRVDNLEGRIAFLEDNQFSTTTKLTGNIFFNITGATADGDVDAETANLNTPLTLRPAGRRDADNNPFISTITEDPEVTFSYYTWLNFNSSFTGQDTLVTQLVAGNGNSPANSFISAGLYNTFGVPFTDQTGAPTAGSVAIRELFYDFPVGEKLRVAVGPRINWYRYFDNNAYTFFLTGASSYNSSGGTLVNAIDRGSGAVLSYEFNDLLTFKVGYLGENTEFLPSAFFNTSSDPDKGLFNATQTLTAEIDLAIAERANIRLMYTRATVDNNQPIFTVDEDGNVSEVPSGFGVGGATGEPIYGVADDGFGGTIGDAPSDTFLVNFDWTILDWLGIFGRYSYGSTDILPRNPDREDGEINAQAFQIGAAFPDLGKEGALGTFSFLVPFDVLDGEEFLAAGGGDGGTQYEFEVTYHYPINDNISILPAFYLVANPNNFEDNPNIYVGNLRLQFKL